MKLEEKVKFYTTEKTERARELKQDRIYLISDPDVTKSNIKEYCRSKLGFLPVRINALVRKGKRKRFGRYQSFGKKQKIFIIDVPHGKEFKLTA